MMPIAKEIQQQIQNYGLVELKCVAQTYDGAAVMIGSTGGEQAHCRRLHPEAIYVHCYAHQLNLVLCNTCKAVPEAVELFSLLECVYSFFSTSLVNHHKFMETQAKLGLTKTELVQLSNTRWACQLRSHKTRHKQMKMENFVLEATVGSRTELNNSDALKRELLFPCVDWMVGELDQRFCSVDAGLLKVIQACSPKSENFLSEPHLNELAKHYRLDLKKEVLVTRNFLTQKTEAGCPPKNMLSVYNLLDSDMFPSLKATIQVALTVPVSSCSCERSFNALRRLHPWLRQTMGQKRLHSLAVMSIEKDMLQHLSHNRVIDRFATLKNRRHSLMVPPTK